MSRCLSLLFFSDLSLCGVACVCAETNPLCQGRSLDEVLGKFCTARETSFRLRDVRRDREEEEDLNALVFLGERLSRKRKDWRIVAAAGGGATCLEIRLFAKEVI